jgi:hypothetical protein
MGWVNIVKGDSSRPITVFAGAARGVFKSVDAGATWTASSLTRTTGALGIAPETLIAAITVYTGTGSGLFKSADGGMTWSPAGVSDQLCSVEIILPIPTTLDASTCSQILKNVAGGGNCYSVGPPEPPISVLFYEGRERVHLDPLTHVMERGYSPACGPPCRHSRRAEP